MNETKFADSLLLLLLSGNPKKKARIRAENVLGGIPVSPDLQRAAARQGLPCSEYARDDAPHCVILPAAAAQQPLSLLLLGARPQGQAACTHA